MAFDIIGARKSGYSDKEIISSLAARHKFDVDAASKAGYSDGDMLGALLSRETVGVRVQSRPVQNDFATQGRVDRPSTGLTSAPTLYPAGMQDTTTQDIQNTAAAPRIAQPTQIVQAEQVAPDMVVALNNVRDPEKVGTATSGFLNEAQDIKLRGGRAIVQGFKDIPETGWVGVNQAAAAGMQALGDSLQPIIGPLSKISDIALHPNDPLAGMTASERAASGITTDIKRPRMGNENLLQQIGKESYSAFTEQSQELSDQYAPDSWGSAVRNAGGQSISQLGTLAMAATVATNPAALASIALSTMGAQAGITEYGGARAAGFTPYRSAVKGAIGGGLEVLTERAPLGSLMNFISSPAKTGIKSFLKAAGVYGAQDIGGELINTMATDVINSKMQARPNMTFQEQADEVSKYFSSGEWKTAAEETLKQTLLQSGMMIGAGKVAQRVMAKTPADQAAPLATPIAPVPVETSNVADGGNNLLAPPVVGGAAAVVPGGIRVPAPQLLTPVPIAEPVQTAAPESEIVPTKPTAQEAQDVPESISQENAADKMAPANGVVGEPIQEGDTVHGEVVPETKQEAPKVDEKVSQAIAKLLALKKKNEGVTSTPEEVIAELVPEQPKPVAGHLQIENKPVLPDLKDMQRRKANIESAMFKPNGEMKAATSPAMLANYATVATQIDRATLPEYKAGNGIDINEKLVTGGKADGVSAVRGEDVIADVPSAQTVTVPVASTGPEQPSPPNSIITQVSDMSGKVLDYIVSPHDGTPDGMHKAALDNSRKMNDYPGASNNETIHLVTDSKGKPVNTINARFGDLSPLPAATIPPPPLPAAPESAPAGVTQNPIAENKETATIDTIGDITNGKENTNRELRGRAFDEGTDAESTGFTEKTVDPGTTQTVPDKNGQDVSIGSVTSGRTSEQTRIKSGEYSLDLHKSVRSRLIDGTLTPEELKESFSSALSNAENIKAELSKLTKAELLKKVSGHYRNENKPYLVKAAYKAMLGSFNLADGLSYSYGEGNYEKALQSKIDSTTQQDITAFSESVKKSQAERKAKIDSVVKAVNDPQTLAEFEDFFKYAKDKTLTPEQQILYDELIAADNKAKGIAVKDQKATVSDAGAVIDSEIIETTHTRDNYPLFVVKASERVAPEIYKQWSTTAKKLSGWYSAYTKSGAIAGFQFKSRENAEAFQSYLNGDTGTATEAVKANQETRSDTKLIAKTEKLRATAEKLQGDAEAELNRDRLANTAKRANQAESSDNAARANVALAKTMLNLAEAIESGEATHLDGAWSKTHVETLNTMLRVAKQLHERKNDISYSKSQERSVGLDDIADAEYPWPHAHKQHLVTIAAYLDTRQGGKRLGEWLRKKSAESKNENVVEFNTAEDIKKLTDALSKVGTADRSAKYAVENTADRMKDYKRLQVMKITDLPSLRAALREFLQFRQAKSAGDKAKSLERALVGNKGIGVDFFPTPASTAKQMVEMAGVTKGMKVLEPSAGNGNIAEQLRDAGADVDVVETSSALREILEAKGFNLAGQDFLEYSPGAIYDAIVMNPPFGNGMDMKHVEHAYSLLKPGGKLVSIVGEGAFIRSGKQEVAFKEWLDENSADVEKLDSNTFTDKTLLATTGANARVVVIEKPTVKESLSIGTETQTSRQGDTAKKQIATRSIISDIRKAGGLTSETINRFIDKKMMQGKSGKGSIAIGIMNKNGLGMDVMAQDMVDQGWNIPLDDYGRPDIQSFSDIVNNALNGDGPVHPSDAEKLSEQEYQQQLEQEYANLSDKELNDIVLSLDADELQAYHETWNHAEAELHKNIVAFETSEESLSAAQWSDRIDEWERSLKEEIDNEGSNQQADEGKQGENTSIGERKPETSQTGSKVETQNKLFATPPAFGKKPQTSGKPISTGDLTDNFTADLQDNLFGTNPQPAQAVATPESEIATVETQTAKLSDFGEKIGGARKDLAGKMADAKKLDIAVAPFAKTWPEPNYQKMLDDGYSGEDVDLVRALRDEIPDKPRKSYQLKAWVPLVESLRDHAERMLSGDAPYVRSALDRMVAEQAEKSRWDRNSVIGNILNRAGLYAIIGHEISLEGVSLEQNHYGVYKGEQNVVKWEVSRKQKATAFSNMPQDLGTGDTKEEAIAAFKKNLGLLSPESTTKKTKFVIYSKAGAKGVYYIGKQAGSNYIDLQTFDSVKDARTYLLENQSNLEVQLAGLKNLPYERKSTNSPRVGQDWRGGKDVTPEMFTSALGFRGTEFGNYLNDTDRQRSLNEFYDAAHDLAAILNIPVKSLSLNGELAIAFGARGHGGKRAAAAHYEPGKVVINLTKHNGAGSLAHEMFHALDSYLSRSRGKANDYITDHAVKYGPQDHTRQELIDAFKEVKKALNATNLKNRSSMLDATRTKAYWGTGIEMHARAFENYVIAKLESQGASNDYLANIKDMGEYAEDLMGGLLSGKDVKDMYPYLLPEEIPAVSEAFDSLFKTIKATPSTNGFTLNFMGLQSMYERIAESKAVNDAAEDIKRLGAHVYANGKTTWKEWFNGMKQALGKLFNRFRAVMEKVYSTTKKDNGTIDRNSAGGAKYDLERNIGAEGLQDSRRQGNELSRLDDGLLLDHADTANAELERRVKRLESVISGSPDGADVTLSPARQGGEDDNGRRVSAIFGKELIYVNNHSRDTFNFSGVAIDDKTIFIEVNTQKPHLYVIGHELVHTIRSYDERNATTYYSDFIKSLAPIINLEEYKKLSYEKRMLALENNIGQPHPDAVAEEIIGDFVGDRLTDKAFWQKLYKLNKSVVQKVMMALKALLGHVKGHIRKTDTMFTDIQKAENIAADFISRHVALVKDGTVKDSSNVKSFADFLKNKLKDKRGLVGVDINAKEQFTPEQWDTIAEGAGMTVAEAKELLGADDAPAIPEKESRLATRTEADAIEAKLTSGLGPMAGYNTMNMKDQAELAAGLMDEDYAKAVQMAMGEIFPPDGVREATMFEAVKIRAIKEGDIDLIRRLATDSTVPTKLSEYGQAIKAADSRLADDPVEAIQDLIDYRAERAKKQGLVSTPEDVAKIEQLEKDLLDAKKSLEEKISQLEAERAIKKMVQTETTRKRTNKRSASKAENDTEFKNLAGEFKRLMGYMHSIGISTEEATVLAQMARNRISKGIRVTKDLIDDIYSELSGIPGLEPRDIRDAISGYGKTFELSGDEIDVTLRELKRQMMLISKIEDVDSGVMPALTGVKRDAKSDTLREMERELHQLMKKSGMDNLHGSEDSMKTALDSAKTRLKNDIHDLDRQIEIGKRDPVKKSGIVYDKEALDLKTIRDAKQAVLDELDAKPGISDARRNEMAIDSIKRSIESYRRQIETGEPVRQASKASQDPEVVKLRTERDKLRSERDEKRKLHDEMKKQGTPDEDPLLVDLANFMRATQKQIQAKESALDRAVVEAKRKISENDLNPVKKVSPTPTTPGIASKQATLDELNAVLKDMQDAAKPPKDPEATRRKAYQTRLANDIAKLEKALEDGDFTKSEKKDPIVLDADGKKLKSAYDKIKEDYHALTNASGTVTKHEVAEIVRLSQLVSETRDAMNEGGDRFEYGSARVVYENYVDELKGIDAPLKTLLKAHIQEIKTTWQKNKSKAILDAASSALSVIADNSIAMVASFDNSFLGRQGLKTLMTHPSAWAPGARKSFSDFAKTIGGQAAYDALRADIYSRPNYLNGEYEKAKIIVKTEEQFPTSLPERIPGVGRVFKASETAFKGSALRMRTDLYDLLSRKAKEGGVDMSDKETVESLGKLINSLTARGKWGKTGEPAIVRMILWAPKMLKGNIDVLTAHYGGAGLSGDFAKKQAAMNLGKIIAIHALLLLIASAFDPESIELDPRSSDFGKIRINSTRFDITGGAASLVTLASRVITRSTKNSESDLVTPYGTGFGQSTPFDALITFITNKVTPPVGVLIEMLKGKDREGEDFSLSGAAFRSFTPISIKNLIDLKDDVSADKVAGALVDFIGLNANSYGDTTAQKGDITNRLRNGKELTEKQREAYLQMSDAQQDKIQKNADMTAILKQFKSISDPSAAIYAYRSANGKQRLELKGYLFDKLDRLDADEKPEQFNKAKKMYEGAGKDVKSDLAPFADFFKEDPVKRMPAQGGLTR